MTPASAVPPDDALVHYFGLPFYKAVFCIAVGAFLAAFLLMFQPFGVSNYDPRFHIDLAFVLFMLGVGVAVSLTLAVSEFVMRPLVLPSPSRAQVFAWLAWDYLLVGSVTFLYYNYVGDWHDWSLHSWLAFLPDVALVISFPVAGFLFYIRHEALNHRFVHLAAAMPAQPSREVLRFTSDNDKEVVAVAAGDLLYLRAEDNYLAIVTAVTGGPPRSRLIRSSLKRIEAMAIPDLVRCHRSYLVNLARVSQCHGNRHGLQLHLHGGDTPIPVSRAYTDAVLAALGAR
jgi:hypothetical protein